MGLPRAIALIPLAGGAACLWLAGAVAQPTPAPKPSLQQIIDREMASSDADLCTDEEFVRRVYLDVVGLPPTRAETLAFLDDKAAEKRARLIDSLLADPRFGEHLADLWLPILRQRGNDLGELGVSAGDVLAVWLARQFNEDVPFNQVVTAIVTAEGPISSNPASAYYALMGFPAPVADAAGLTLKNFAGMQMQCAQCHDHPFERAWTQNAFKGVASFFSAIEVKADFYTQPIDPALHSKDLPARALIEAYGKGKGLPPEAVNRVNDLLTYDRPQLPGDSPVKTRNAESWRRMVASWLTSPKNRTAMQYQVNRFWSFLFGRGFVNPVDDFSSLNPPSHPALLDVLADEWSQSFRVKAHYRAILGSRAWQQSSRAKQTRVRPLTPEQFFGALLGLVEGDGFIKAFERHTQNTYQKLSQFGALAGKGGMEAKIDKAVLERYLEWTNQMRPQWRIRRGLAAQFASASSDDERTQGESLTGTIDQALMVMNGEVTRRLGGSLNGSLVFAIMRDFKETPSRVEAMYLSILSRRPSAGELNGATKLVQAAPNASEGLEDLFFALISTTEFGTNH